MLQIGQEIRATVEKLIFSGKGLVRYQGWVIFVEDVVSCEEVLLTITEKKKSFYLAKLNKVITKSKERIEPYCNYFGPCGGCQLQHLSYPAQIQAKEMWLKEALHGIAKQKLNFPISVHPAPKEFEYRRKVCLHFRFEEGIWILGYYERDNKSLIQIKSCPIFCEKKDPIFEEIKAFFKHLKGYQGCTGDIFIMKNNEKYLVRIVFHKKLCSNATKVIDSELKNFPRISTVLLESPSESVEGGEKLQEDFLAGFKLNISPRIFLQNFPELSLKLYLDVVELVKGIELLEKRVLDLYSGIGLLSLLLAKEAQEVLGVELNYEAVQLALDNAKLNDVKNIHFISASVEAALKDKLKDREFPIWIVNPPREGLSEQVVGDILRSCPEYLIYISCMPSTLSRDLFKLCVAKYEVKKVQGYDMFPQTTHLETVVFLKLKDLEKVL